MEISIAGHHAGGGTSLLFAWDGKADTAELTAVDLRGYNPEGFFTAEDRDEVMIVSDDG